MSTATMRLRRAGAGGLAAAVIAGTLVATAGSALAWSGGALTFTPTTAAVSTTTVTAGGAATSADDVTVTIPASGGWNVNDTLKFDLSATGATCLTTSAFVAWTSLTPSVAFATTGTTGTLPTFTASNSTAGACSTLGKQTSATLTFTNSGTAPSTSAIKITIKHAVQAGAAIADGTKINVTATVGGTSPSPATYGPMNVAKVTAVGITAGTPVVLTPSTAGQAVPDVTVKEAVPGTIAVGNFVITYNNATAVDVSKATATWTGQTTAPVPTVGPGANQVTVPIATATTSTTGAGTLTLKGVKVTTGAVTPVTAQGQAVTASIANGSMADLGVNSNVGRVGGSDRYYTAAALYNAGFPVSSNPKAVILASGANFPDALSASALAGATGAGILLTAPTALPAPTQFAITARLATLKTVYIIGGTGAVSASVAAQVAALGTTASPLQVVRLGGSDRYATDQLVNDFAASLGGGLAKTAVVATGTNFADALAVGPEVVHENYGMVLTNPTSLSPAAAATLVNNGFTSVIIVGGTGAVSANVESQIKALGITVAYRLAGSDRTETAAQIATWATMGVPPVGTTYAAAGPLAGFTAETVHVARGDIFADALAAGPVAAAFDSGNGTAILLTVNPTVQGTGSTGYVSALAADGTNVGTVNGLGLGGAVTTAQLNSVALSILG